MERPTICVCLIVKNEAEVIERCLASARPHIDYWVICDTGSTDGTQDLIRAALDGIPGELHERPWQNFGHNRSELLRLAQDKADYLLLLDADWTIELRKPDALAGLGAECYLVRHEHVPAGDFELYNRHLVTGRREWRYLGVTHEYIVTDGDVSTERVDGVVIVNHADGGVGRAQRWRQDAELLEAEDERNPDDPRTIFYLAQTYRDLGETDRAVGLYERRASLGGWEEEVYYSLHQVGVLRAEGGDWPGGLAALISAWEVRPRRLEALYELVCRLRIRHEHQTAHLFARAGVGRPQPGDILFVSPWVYRWGLLFEYSITSYWVGDARASLDACNRLLAMDDLPDLYREQTVANRQYAARAMAQSASMRRDKRPLPPGSTSTSSTSSRRRRR
ncbi:MAG TPA: glycosyltransferase [Solirubrobacteraceae bacterium]|jgi:tetratricopeptide (TPR) repeat protein|nr:glycosyltransferase [Solirubrobacteraceae bacterium]